MPSRVDLPEPEGPVSAIHSPGSTVKETPLRMGTRSPPRGRERVRSMASIAGLSGCVMVCTTHPGGMYYMTMP